MKSFLRYPHFDCRNFNGQYLLQHPVRGAGFGEKLVVLHDKQFVSTTVVGNFILVKSHNPVSAR
jgi:hypothetical protein